MKPIRTAFLLTAIVLTLACAAPPAEPPDLSDQAASEVEAAVQAWNAAAAAKDVEAFVGFYADDAILMMEQAPDMIGPAIREGLTEMMADPNFALSFAADKVVASRSGDMAWEHGTFTMTMSGPEGQPMPMAGTYVAIWHKQDDGTWKCVVDAPISGPPA